MRGQLSLLLNFAITLLIAGCVLADANGGKARWQDQHDGKKYTGYSTTCPMPSDFMKFCFDGGYKIEGGFAIPLAGKYSDGRKCLRMKLPDTVEEKTYGVQALDGKPAPVMQTFHGKFAPSVRNGGIDGTVQISGDWLTITFWLANGDTCSASFTSSPTYLHSK
ncbi:hypothetical protein HDU93_007287 [Gonapodya sp. JEL0774]|nr:hypothetical protein HDU93_007287 [Gonapodya sp. JEL0774]